MSKEDELLRILAEGKISTHFQSIISADGQSVYAYEALSRGPAGSALFSPVSLFKQAKQQQKLFALESVCRTKAIEQFTRQKLPGKLFINISPETLLQPDHHKGFTLDLINNFGISPEQVVIELTEHSPINDYDLMRRAVKHYQSEGFCIALDDLGAGYSSLILWSEVQPDYVKIDRHFITGIEKDRIKRDFVRSIVAIARSVKSQVIAEGVETLNEFETLSEIGVDYLQGYYFAKPNPTPSKYIDKDTRAIWGNVKSGRDIYKGSSQVGELKQDVVSVSVDTLVEEVVAIFESNEQWFTLPVVSDGIPVGIVKRSGLLEKLSKPFGRDLYVKKPVFQILEERFISVERHTRLEVVSQLVIRRDRNQLQEDFIITEQGKYFGVGQVIDLLRMITDMQMASAKNSNPLTGLPSNLLVREYINKLIVDGKSFVVCYFDLDNFKPYNDQYGYDKGDIILLFLARLLQKHCQSDVDFVGHIGGDDYVVVFRSGCWNKYVENILDEFSQQCASFYNPAHLSGNGIWAANRSGEQQFFNLMSVSVAAVDSNSASFDSAAAVSSRLSLIKAQAKSIAGNSLVAELSGSIHHYPSGSDHSHGSVSCSQ